MRIENISIDLKEGQHLTIVPLLSDTEDEIKAVALTKEDIRKLIDYMEMGGILFSICVGLTGLFLGILFGAIFL